MASRTQVLLVGIAILLTASCAQQDQVADAADRTVVVSMRDNHFEPDAIEVERGESILFRFANDGANIHDAFIGGEHEQAEHERQMQATDDAHGDHGETSDAITLKPDERGSLSYTFTDAGRVEIGCHQPGHYASGMKVSITVSA